MKHIWLITVVFVACGAVAASAQPGPAAKDGEAPRATSASPPVGGSTAAAKTSGDSSTKDGGEVQQTSVFGSKRNVPWRNSSFVYRNSFSAISLSDTAELSYNPYYAMTYSIRPWWWFTKKLYVRGALELDHEVTNADTTTQKGEAWLRDLMLSVGYANAFTIPKAKINFSFSLILTIPTSKASLAKTMVLGVGPGVRLTRSFKVLKGMMIGYNFRSTFKFHRYTTGERESPLITSCGGGLGGCDQFLNMGLRNSMVRLSHSADFSIRFLKWLGLSLAVGQAFDFLYPLGDEVLQTSTGESAEGENIRYLTFFEVVATFQPTKELEIGVGYTSVHPQRTPSSTYYVPFFNRYSAFYIDLKLRIDGLVDRIKRRGK